MSRQEEGCKVESCKGAELKSLEGFWYEQGISSFSFLWGASESYGKAVAFEKYIAYISVPLCKTDVE